MSFIEHWLLPLSHLTAKRTRKEKKRVWKVLTRWRKSDNSSFSLEGPKRETLQHLKCTTAERTLACRVSKQRRRSGAPLQNGPGYCCTLVYNNLLRTSFVRKCRRRQILTKTNCPSFRHQNFCQKISLFFLKWSVFEFSSCASNRFNGIIQGLQKSKHTFETKNVLFDFRRPFVRLAWPQVWECRRLPQQQEDEPLWRNL